MSNKVSETVKGLDSLSIDLTTLDMQTESLLRRLEKNGKINIGKKLWMKLKSKINSTLSKTR